MTGHRQLTCVACEKPFTVDDSQDTTRCPRCGTQYEGPWDDPTILSSPPLSDEEIEAANAGKGPTVGAASEADTDAEETIRTTGGVTIRITIEILPE